MMQNNQYDLAIVGGGPGGYVAAIRAGQLGLRTLLVERAHLGGICLNWGCIPTKALLRSAEVYHQMLDAKAYGLTSGGPRYDIGKVVQRSRRISQDLSRGVAHLLKKNKVSVMQGHARLAGAGKLNVGLETTKVEVRNNHIVTDEWYCTAEAGVYAIGDIAGAPWLAHKASHEGMLCVESIAGRRGLHPLVRERIPGCTYSRPQIASIGMTETTAIKRGRAVRVGRFPFHGNGKAIALGEPEGLVKTIFDSKSGELLGAPLVGAEVTELVQGFSIGMAQETTEEELMHTIFPHLTLSEMMHEATLSAYERAIHI